MDSRKKAPLSLGETLKKELEKREISQRSLNSTLSHECPAAGTD